MILQRCCYPGVLTLLVGLILVNAAPSPLFPIVEQCVGYCSNSGVCEMVDGSPRCICLPEWEGMRCEDVRKHKANEKSHSVRVGMANPRNTACSYVPNLCEHGGICYVDGNKFNCYCPEPYEGDRCQDKTMCADYCANGGICTYDKTTTTASCKCLDGWVAPRCLNRDTTTTTASTTSTAATTASTTTPVLCGYLDANYCNGGTCGVANNRVVCQCPPTQTGERCETPLGPSPPPGCISGYCKNGGICQGPPVECFCKAPWTGLQCDTQRIVSTDMPTGPSTATPPPATPPPATPPPATLPTATLPPVTGPTTMNPPGVTCAQNPCQNNRPCYANGNSYYCYCGPAYQGLNCQTPIG